LIGGKCFHGSGPRKDEKKAVYWLRLSAEKGNINSLKMKYTYITYII
jgi:TPR repeat protein